MKSLLIKSVLRLKGEIVLLGDKSIAHRCIIVSALAEGETTIENFPTNKDCLYTIAAFKKLGIKIKQEQLKTPNKPPVITVFGKGLYGLKKPKGPLFVGDSGTTLRLLLGVLAGQDFNVRLIGSKSLSRRPMLRVTQALRLMGAEITANRKWFDRLTIPRTIPSETEGPQTANRIEEYLPITIKGKNLRSITYKMPVASAQVKSAILLAGLYTGGRTSVIEPIPTRDHTERILKLFKADIKLQQNKIVMKGQRELISPQRIYVPGDISSASFFMVAAVILPHSRICIKKVSLNPSRIGIIRVLKRMGAHIKVQGSRFKVQGCEPMGDLLVKSSFLKGTRVKKKEVPSLIDELPVLMVAACVAEGKTIFEGVEELRVKETDRIRSMSENLRKMGANIEVFNVGKSENIIIKGIKQLQGAKVRSFGDHRTAMSIVIAGMCAKGKTLVDDIICINKSFPEFLHTFKKIIY